GRSSGGLGATRASLPPRGASHLSGRRAGRFRGSSPSVSNLSGSWGDRAGSEGLPDRRGGDQGGRLDPPQRLGLRGAGPAHRPADRAGGGYVTPFRLKRSWVFARPSETSARTASAA